MAWAAEPEHDDRKKMGLQWMLAIAFAAAATGYAKRWRFSTLKSRKISYNF